MTAHFYSCLQVLMTWLEKPVVRRSHELKQKLELLQSSLDPPSFDQLPGGQELNKLLLSCSTASSVPINKAAVMSALRWVRNLRFLSAQYQTENREGSKVRNYLTSLYGLIVLVRQQRPMTADELVANIEELLKPLDAEARRTLPGRECIGKLLELERGYGARIVVASRAEGLLVEAWRLGNEAEKAQREAEAKLDRKVAKVLGAGLDAELEAARTYHFDVAAWVGDQIRIQQVARRGGQRVVEREKLVSLLNNARMDARAELGGLLPEVLRPLHDWLRSGAQSVDIGELIDQLLEVVLRLSAVDGAAPTSLAA